MIEKLDSLNKLGKGSNAIKNYLSIIATDSDDYISAGALCQLIEMNLIDTENENLLLSHSHIPCVRRLAVFYFLATGQFQNSAQAASSEKGAPPFNHENHLQFAINHDTQNLIKSEAALFLENGQLNHLFKTAAYALEWGGESDALPWLIRATLIAPKHPKCVFETLTLLNMTDRHQELEDLANKFIGWNIQAPVAKIFLAQRLLNRSELNTFNRLVSSIPMDRLDQRMRSLVHGLIAKSKEKEGNYKEASECYLRQNNPKSDNRAKKSIFINKVHVTETLCFDGQTPSAPNHFMMLGFPRSGTTLLENALSSHPEIETFEEIPAFSSMRDGLLSPFQQSLLEDRHVDTETWRNATGNYYEQIRLRSRKEDASIFIDKMPINTAFAGMLSRCFPDKRYIFSIRHPYDVVLSCYKQFFSDNPTMEHFKRFEDACALYDFVMKRWFKFFSDDDPRVCYIRYDSLVTDFQHETTRALEFLDLHWNNEILNFSENAKQRAALTPSYEKVRQGIGIGVQSSWKKYPFLYDGANKKHLDYWVEKFGYEGI